MLSVSGPSRTLIPEKETHDIFFFFYRYASNPHASNSASFYVTRAVKLMQIFSLFKVVLD